MQAIPLHTLENQCIELTIQYTIGHCDLSGRVRLVIDGMTLWVGSACFDYQTMVTPRININGNTTYTVALDATNCHPYVNEEIETEVAARDVGGVFYALRSWGGNCRSIRKISKSGTAT